MELHRSPLKPHEHTDIGAALADIRFPATKQEVIAALGDRSLDFHGLPAPLSAIVRGVPEGRFRDAAQAERAVGARWARIAKSLAAIEKAEHKQER